MLNAAGLYAELNLDDVPMLTGAQRLTEDGFRSTLYPQLQPYFLQCDIEDGLDANRVDLLVDPQTSGGLLIALPQEEAKRITDDFASAVVIGKISADQNLNQGRSATTADKRIRIC